MNIVVNVSVILKNVSSDECNLCLAWYHNRPRSSDVFLDCQFISREKLVTESSLPVYS